jgi:hypothetical protein
MIYGLSGVPEKYLKMKSKPLCCPGKKHHSRKKVQAKTLRKDDA